MHARHFAEMEEVDGLVLFDVVEGRAADVAGKVGSKARAAATLVELFGEADAVLIAASTPAHPEMIGGALARGGRPSARSRSRPTSRP